MRQLWVPVLAIWLAGTAANADGLRAILVGVSDYQHIDADLRGPRNDVRLMRETLVSRGVSDSDISILSEDGETPTRDAILAALDAAAAGAGPGDTVLFYFSGHGTQAPDREGDEQGGQDEIFLPADAKGWSDETRAVENAIFDDEFRARAAAILQRDARLVAILDACHSATGFRAVGGQGVARTVPQAVLGVPDVAPGAAEPTAVAPLQGDFVFLYAAQSDERAFEFPVGPPEDDGNWHGAFTFALTQVLQLVPDLRWDQAMQVVRATMKQGAHTQTPDAEGPMLAAPVFGAVAPVATRIPYDPSGLGAGQLQDVDPGAQLAIFADPVAIDPVARAEVTEATARSAKFRVTEGTAPAAGFVEVTAPGLPAEVRFSTPQIVDTADYSNWIAALQKLASEDRIDGVIFDSAAFDIGLVLENGRLALTGADGVLDPRGPGSSTRVTPDDLAGALDRAARVHRLRGALGRGGTPGASALLQAVAGLKVEAGHRKGRASGGGCRRTDAPEQRPVADGQVVAPCDEVWLHLRNLSPTPRDVTVLYVDSTNVVTALWPPAGLSNRLMFNEEIKVGAQIVAGDSTRGQEELIVIGVPSEPGAPRTVLTALADPAPSRGGGGTPAADYLLQAADPSSSGRSYSLRGPVDPVEVTRITLDFHASPPDR
ncbi:caspase family protein [Seohaeicola saemankumensis]|nr:caspase family protein [Seohaeicola saemankumensis]MCA0873775.1 caspase family protein [Seohaeicola saemankumensis]